ncbi:hypothetical protein BSKO_10972 [Bryopsis sp. KO-2023]|nr:hypothetical protein BSKO_10972 [Bryopsis sp. KO-2023]
MAALLGTMSLGVNSSCFQGRRLVARPISAPRVSAPLVCPVQAGTIGYGKKWEHLPVHKKTGKVIRQKIHVQVGDYVVVITGNDKGKMGEVTRVDTKFGYVWLDGVNMKTRYTKPSSEDESGTMQEKEGPVHHSNVMHYSKEQQVRSRLGRKIVDGKKVRFLKKTGEVLA